MVTIGIFLVLVTVLFFVFGSPFIARKITKNAELRDKLHLEKVIEVAGILAVLALFMVGC